MPKIRSDFFTASWKLQHLRGFLLIFSKKVVPDQFFFFWISKGIEHFLHIFCKKKNMCFFSKIPYYRDYQFWKCWFQKSTFFFSIVFRRLRKSFGWYYTGVLAQKIERYMAWYPFFFCDILFFFAEKSFRGWNRQKKKKISLLKSRISLFNLTSVPYFGIKRGYQPNPRYQQKNVPICIILSFNLITKREYYKILAFLSTYQ